MVPQSKLCPKNENHWPAASDAMFDNFKELKKSRPTLGGTKRKRGRGGDELFIDPQASLRQAMN
jgi:hypothetical protein